MTEHTLRWGPCDGDVVELDDLEREIRVPVICGTCLDELPANLGREVYTEALYMRDSEGRWVYSGRFRYRQDGTAYWHPS